MSREQAFPAIRRVVTAHDANGRAVIGSDGPLATVVELGAIPGTVFHEVWSTEASPAPVGNGPDPSLGPIKLAPPRGGTRIRFVDIPPDTEDFLKRGAERMNARLHRDRRDACLDRQDQFSAPPDASHRVGRLRRRDLGRNDADSGQGRDAFAGGRCRHPARDQPRVGEPVRQAVPDAVHPRRWPLRARNSRRRGRIS